MAKDKISQYCGIVTRFSLYLAAFYIPISIALIETFAGLAIASWLLRKVITRENPAGILKQNILWFPVLLYFFVCLLASIISSNRAISFNHLIFKTTEYILIFFIVADTAERKFLKNILIVLMVSAGLVGIDGIFQYFTNFDFFRGRGPAILGRINGPFPFPNDFGNYTVSLLPLAASLAFLKFKTLWARRALIFTAAVLFVCIILSVARSSWFALLLALPAAGLLGNKKLLLFILLLITFIFIFFPFIPNLPKARMGSLFDYKKTMLTADRFFILKTGVKMVINRPVLGQGLGTFMFNFNKFKSCPAAGYPGSEGISYAHNCFLQIAAETGLLGLAYFLLIIAALFIYSFILILKFKLKGSNDFFILTGILTGIFAYLVSSFFDTNLYSLPLAVLFWFMLGLAAGVIKIIKQEKKIILL